MSDEVALQTAEESTKDHAEAPVFVHDRRGHKGLEVFDARFGDIGEARIRIGVIERKGDFLLGHPAGDAHADRETQFADGLLVQADCRGERDGLSGAVDQEHRGAVLSHAPRNDFDDAPELLRKAGVMSSISG